jgi:membrane fusion protein, multidrug efflux system
MKKFIVASRLFLVAIIAFALVKCGENHAAAPRLPEDEIPVKLQPVERHSQSRPVEYSGMIATNSDAKLSFKIGGIISKIFVKEGDRVSAGQLLATLDLTGIDAEVQQAVQNVEKARRDAGRLQNLYNDTVASLEQLQNINTQVNVAAEGLRIAQFDRQYAQIRASAGGVILQKFLNEGEYVAAGTAVLWFNGAATNTWVVRFGVSDRDWASVKLGDRATIAIDAYPDKSFNGEISKLAEGADAASGTYPVEVKLSPGGCKFAPGLFCSVKLQPSVKQTLTLIPAGALVEGEKSTGYVYTLNNDHHTVKKNLIHIAFFEKDKIAVSSGLEHIDSLITDGAGYLTERSIVKVAE